MKLRIILLLVITALTTLLSAPKSYADTYCSDLNTGYGKATYTLSDVLSGNLTLWLRIKSSDGNPSINYNLGGGGSSCDKTISASSATSWRWISATESFVTSGGTVTLQLSATKSDVGVDCFVLSSDNSFSPSNSDDCTIAGANPVAIANAKNTFSNNSSQTSNSTTVKSESGINNVANTIKDTVTAPFTGIANTVKSNPFGSILALVAASLIASIIVIYLKKKSIHWIFTNKMKINTYIPTNHSVTTAIHTNPLQTMYNPGEVITPKDPSKLTHTSGS